MLMIPTNNTQALFDSIEYPITFQQCLMSIIPIYPAPLSGFKIIKKENGICIVDFPIKPTFTPLEAAINHSIHSLNPLRQVNAIYINMNDNPFVQDLLKIINNNKETIEGYTGLTLEQFMNTNIDIIKKEDKKSSIVLADEQGNVEGDIIELIMDI